MTGRRGRALLVLFVVAACEETQDRSLPKNAEPPTSPPANTDAVACEPTGDSDGDRLSDSIEGCLFARDSDGDGKPDWLATDSDGDGVSDGDEDRNGDGKLGLCAKACDSSHDCTGSASCIRSLCVSFRCLAGETDPTVADTDANGILDDLESTRICNPATEDSPEGRRDLLLLDSSTLISDATPDWRLALDPAAWVGVVQFANPAPQESSIFFDWPNADGEVAGFLLSRPVSSGETNATAAAHRALAHLGAGFAPGVRSAQVRMLGVTQTVDESDVVLGTSILVETTAWDVTLLRQEVVVALSGEAASDLIFPAVPWAGHSAHRFIVAFQTVLRADRDEVLFAGAVSSALQYDDPASSASMRLTDLSYGSGLTTSGRPDATRCDALVASRSPKADIAFILDQSGSMEDDRANVVANATNFFERAKAAGLDFRLGVTGMDPFLRGQFAARNASASTGDRWLGPDEQAAFEMSVADPAGPDESDGGEYGLTQARAAVLHHLPRSDSDPARVRPDAKLVVILVSDEKPQELEDAGILPDGDTTTTPWDRSAILTAIKDTLSTMEENDVQVHAIAVPEPYPSCSDTGEVGWGYLEMVDWFGGQFGSICQADLGATLGDIVDDVVGSSSTLILKDVPIAASIQVVRDGQIISRSRKQGWDYRTASNAVVFYDLPFDPASPSEITISYRTWGTQDDIN